jgi:hypothetical protein
MPDNSAAPHLNGRCRSSGARLSAVMAKGEVDEFFLLDREKEGLLTGLYHDFMVWRAPTILCSETSA